MMRSIVVLPQPDGPTSVHTSPGVSAKAMSRSTSRLWPESAPMALRPIQTSSRANSPAERASYKGLHQKDFDDQDHGDESQRIGQDARDVEQLKCHADLEPDAVRPPEQFDDQHDLPHQR